MLGRRPLAFLCLILVAAAGAIARIAPAGGFDVEDGSLVSVEGRIKRWERREKGMTYDIEDVWMMTEEGQYRLKGRRTDTLRVYAGLPEKEGKICKVGYRIAVFGTFYELETATNPGQFDSQSYWAAKGVGGSMWAERINIQEAQADWMPELAARCAAKLADTADRLFGAREAGVLKAMLLGAASDMEEEIESAYRRAGIVHLISVSGLHVTAMGGGIYRLLKRLGTGRIVSAAAALLFLIFYSVMLGERASSMRAIGMFFIFLAGDVRGEAYDSMTALAVLAALLAVRWPDQVWQTGYQLSFMASGGAVYSSEVTKERRRRKKEEERRRQRGSEKERGQRRRGGVEGERQRREGAGEERLGGEQEGRLPIGLADSLFSTLRIQLAVLPILMSSYGEISLCGLAVNLLLVPSSSWILGLGAAALMAGCLWEEAGIFLGAPVELLLRLYEYVSVSAASLPGAVWICGCPKLWQTAVYVIGILALELRFWSRGLKRGRGERIACAAVIAGIFVRISVPYQVVFLDVGQGDAAVLRESGGLTVLIDGGSSDVSEAGNYRLIPFLKYMGIGHLDYVLISHGDADHYSAVAELMENGEIGIGKLVVSWKYIEEREDKSGIGALIALAEARGIPVAGAGEGSMIAGGSLSIECIYPREGWSGSSENNCSVIWRASCRGIRILFTGDMEEEEEKALMADYRGREEALRADILKAAHHGSRTSGGEDFLEAVNPRAAVISCGQDNSYGHPHEETLNRLEDIGCRTFITARMGAISVEGRGGHVVIRPLLPH